jgi:hypothetical protein
MSIVTVYVHLLHEGTTVLRPVPAIPIHDNIYLLEKVPDYDPDDEEWEFLPGSRVQCELETHEDEQIIVAKKLVD